MSLQEERTQDEQFLVESNLRMMRHDAKSLVVNITTYLNHEHSLDGDWEASCILNPCDSIINHMDILHEQRNN